MDAIIEVAPRGGEFWLREEDIFDIIEKEGSNIALILFSGVSYYTGQYFPVKSMTKAAKAKVGLQIRGDRDFEIHQMLPGVYFRVGYGPRGW